MLSWKPERYVDVEGSLHELKEAVFTRTGVYRNTYADTYGDFHAQGQLSFVAGL